MIKTIPAPDHVAAFAISGTLTADDYGAMLPVIEQKLADHESIGVVADLTGFEDMTGDAMRQDLQYLVQKFGEIHRFKKSAVISDKKWIEAFVKIASSFVPQVDVRVFAPGDQDAAVEWASSAQ